MIRHGIELKPCPFCGCEMTLFPVLTPHGQNQRYIPVPKGKNSKYGCHKRGCQLENLYNIAGKTKETALKRWNRREGEQE